MTDITALERQLHDALARYVRARQDAGLMDPHPTGTSHVSFHLQAFIESGDEEAVMHFSTVLDPCVPKDERGRYALDDLQLAPIPTVAAVLMSGMAGDLGDRAHDDAVRFKTASENALMQADWVGHA